MKNSTEKAKIIYEGSTTVALIVPSILLSLYFIYLTTKLNFNIDYIVYSILMIASWLFWYFLSYNKRLLLTEHKVYIVKGKKKLCALSLAKDINTISFTQKGWGTRLGYGNLFIEDKNGDEHTYLFIASPKLTYEKIVYAMETKYLKLNPDFVRTVNLEDMTDSIDSVVGLDNIEKPANNEDNFEENTIKKIEKSK